MPSRMRCLNGHSMKAISTHGAGPIEARPTIGPWRLVSFPGVSVQIERSASSTVS